MKLFYCLWLIKSKILLFDQKYRFFGLNIMLRPSENNFFLQASKVSPQDVKSSTSPPYCVYFCPINVKKQKKTLILGLKSPILDPKMNFDLPKIFSSERAKKIEQFDLVKPIFLPLKCPKFINPSP